MTRNQEAISLMYRKISLAAIATKSLLLLSHLFLAGLGNLFYPVSPSILRIVLDQRQDLGDLSRANLDTSNMHCILRT